MNSSVVRSLNEEWVEPNDLPHSLQFKDTNEYGNQGSKVGNTARDGSNVL